MELKAENVGVLETENEDVRSLRELIIYGVKGMAAYAEHAYNLDHQNEEIFAFMQRALASTLDDSLSADDLVALTLETGKYGVDVMALLDKANTSRYGNPEITKVNIGVRNNPAILISGHDLRDMEDLLEKGEIVGGFAHNQVMQIADKVVDAVKGGAIKKFFVMAGCDGRMKSRSYYTDFAQQLPQDTVILTAGCAKFRYNKLDLGDIGGIPRVLDAGQCNDSYSLAVIAMKLKEVFELNDINDLPIEYNIAWYEQKAVIVLLALLYLGVKDIHLGPTLPAFLSPNVANVLVEKFGISGIGEVEEDIKAFMA